MTQVVRTSGLSVAQKAARHSDVRLTTDTYGHLDMDDLRQGIMRAFPAPPDGAPPAKRRHLRAVKE